jgi:hypothetical protein
VVAEQGASRVAANLEPCRPCSGEILARQKCAGVREHAVQKSVSECQRFHDVSTSDGCCLQPVPLDRSDRKVHKTTCRVRSRSKPRTLRVPAQHWPPPRLRQYLGVAERPGQAAPGGAGWHHRLRWSQSRPARRLRIDLARARFLQSPQESPQGRVPTLFASAQKRRARRNTTARCRSNRPICTASVLRNSASATCAVLAAELNSATRAIESHSRWGHLDVSLEVGGGGWESNPPGIV